MNSTHAKNKFELPMFSIQYTISGTGTEIRLNDIPIVFSDSKGKTISEKQIPESIINGKNSLIVRSFPLNESGNRYDENAFIDVTLYIHEKDSPINSGYPIIHLKVNPTSQGEQILDGTNSDYGETPRIFEHIEHQTVVGRQVVIQSPYPQWAWQDGQTIENTPDNYNSLLDKYKEIWKALSEGNKNKVFVLYDHAAKEFATAYHYKNIESGHRLMDTGGLMNDEEWTLGDTNKLLSRMPYHLNIYANGKMAKIIDDKHGKSPILYINKENQNLLFYKFGFYKNNNGEWVMIR